jgi:hypothetical protein
VLVSLSMAKGRRSEWALLLVAKDFAHAVACMRMLV